MSDTTDIDLVLRGSQGDQGAFVELIGRYRGPLTALIRRLVSDVDHADDLLQETVIRCWQSIAGVRDPERFRPWLFQVARNCCRDYQRLASRKEQPVEQLELEYHVNQYGRTGACERISSDVEDALGCLPSAERVAVELFYLQGLNIKELSTVTNSSTSAVKTRLFSARNHMRSYFGVNDEKGDEK